MGGGRGSSIQAMLKARSPCEDKVRTRPSVFLNDIFTQSLSYSQCRKMFRTVNKVAGNLNFNPYKNNQQDALFTCNLFQ